MLDFLRKQMKLVMAIVVVAFLLSTFFMYEGRSTRRSPSVNADGTMTDYEVAQINGRSFMRSELENRTRSYISSLGVRNVASLDMAAVYQTVLNQAVLESQLVKEIDEKGIRVSDADAEQAMKVYADTYYPTRETFYQALANSGIKVEDYQRNLARQIAVDQLMTKAIGEIEISEDKALEFYDSMKKIYFTQPEGFMVHMADFNNNADAEAFRAKLTAGESWDVIASADNKSEGVVNITKSPVFLHSSTLKMGTLSVLDSLDIAEPSEVFTVSSTDFAVGLKASRVEETTRPYSEVSGDIKSLLTQEEQRKRLADYEETLRTKAQLVINDKDLFTSKAVSKDEAPAPAIEIEEVKEESKPEETVKGEELEVSNEKTETPEPAVETKTEVKAEEVKPVEEAKEEEKAETPAAEPEAKNEPKEAAEPEAEVKQETPAVEEVKEESKPEEKAEDVKPAEEVKEETKTEEPAKTEEVKEEAKPVEEVKVEEKTETPAPVVEPEIKEETKPESAQTTTEEVKNSAVEAASEVKEEIKNEVEKAVETMTESLDANKLEIPTETK